MILTVASLLFCACHAVDDASVMLQSGVTSSRSEAKPSAGGDAVLAPTPGDAVPSAVSNESAGITQSLVFCNAFTSRATMSCTLRRTGASLATLPYKSCASTEATFEDGDHFDFKEEADANSNATMLGSFVVKEMPKETHTLLLIIDRKADSIVDGGDEVSFISHAFDGVSNDAAQVAVIDVFGGDSRKESDTDLHIQGDGPPMNMRFNGVATILSGRYMLSLSNANTTFDAANATNYVILRVGADGIKNALNANVTDHPFPEELVVFPNPLADSLLKSGSTSLATPALVLGFLAMLLQRVL